MSLFLCSTERNCILTTYLFLQIAVLTRSLSEHRPEWIRPLVTLMIPRMQSPSDAYRIAAAAVLSALTKRYILILCDPFCAFVDFC